MAESIALLSSVTAQFSVNTPSFYGYQNTVQSLGNQTWTGLLMDVTVDDNYAGHSNVTNANRYTCQLAGFYSVSGCYAPTSNSTGFRAVRISKNATPLLGASAYYAVNTVAEMGCCTPVVLVSLVPGDFVEVQGWQNTGGNLNTVLDTDLRCSLNVRFIHY
jgi:hypothetical protein